MPGSGSGNQHPTTDLSDEKNHLKVLQTQFMHSVSHELRTPLQIIQGYAELLQSGTFGVLAPSQEQAT